MEEKGCLGGRTIFCRFWQRLKWNIWICYFGADSTKKRTLKRNMFKKIRNVVQGKKSSLFSFELANRKIGLRSSTTMSSSGSSTKGSGVGGLSQARGQKSPLQLELRPPRFWSEGPLIRFTRAFNFLFRMLFIHTPGAYSTNFLFCSKIVSPFFATLLGHWIVGRNWTVTQA